MEELENGVVEETTADVADPQDDGDTGDIADPQEQEEPAGEPAKAPDEPPAEPEIPNEVWRTARERAEREAGQRLAAERVALDKNISEIFAGQINPYTNQPIRTAADLTQYHTMHAEEQRRQQFAAAGIDPGLIASMISEHPTVRQAANAVAQMEQERASFRVTEGIKAISSIDPDIKTPDDIPLEIRPAFEQALGRGLSFADAYKLAAWDKLTGKKVAAAKQAAINSARGKDHQQTTTGGGANNAVHVPPEVMSEYKRFGYTEKEAAADYALMQKGK